MISQFTILSYARRYKRELIRLMTREDRLHIHLDWQTVDEWLDEPDTPIFLAMHNNSIVGAMAAAPPLGDSTWVRLVTIAPHIAVESVIAELWTALKVDLLARNVQHIAILLLRPWIQPYIKQLGFQPLESIVTLRREGTLVPERQDTDTNVSFRVADWHDIPAVAEVDHRAFEPTWQLSATSIRFAARMSARFTVAEIDNKIVAYQLSTLYREGAHLARLATIPDIQGKGIGGMLLDEMIRHYVRRNVFSITVNTQRRNVKSLSLYKRFGFDFTGLDMDVWSIEI
jgi:[ribosomal protein S18]-alanine N-acetyltransferase